MTKIIEIKDLHFKYDQSKKPLFESFNINIKEGDFIAIDGISGSGKSTLLYLMAGLLKSQKGQIIINGTAIDQLKDLDLSVLRNQCIGFVFQQFYLLHQLTALENILLPTFYTVEDKNQNHLKDHANHLADQLGIKDCLLRKPHQLSGGQNQRVAIARALINDPDILLIDEPTGNLDSISTQRVLELFQKLHLQGKSIILVTHEKNITPSKFSTLKDGQLISKKTNKVIDKLPKKSLKDIKKNNYLGTTQVVLKTILLSLKSISKNKIRSLLTMLGVVIGVTAIFSMITLGNFTKSKLLDSYTDLGINTLTLMGDYNWPKAINQINLPFRSFDWKTELLYLKQKFPGIYRTSPYLIDRELTVIFSGRSIEDTPTLIGVSKDGLHIIDRHLLKGVYINTHHVEGRHPVCVIGFEIGKRLFSNVSPIGQMLYLSKQDYNTFACRIIGLLENKISHSPSNPNLEVYIPFTVFQIFSSISKGQIKKAVIQVKEGRDIQKIGDAVQNFFENKYDGTFYVGSESFLIEQAKKNLNLFSILLGMMALVFLLIGGISIANMMLVTVSEKFKEIGIRKAIGASNSSIRNQFLLESIILCSLAGIIGIILGIGIYQSVIYGASQFINDLEFQWIFDPIAFLLSFISTLVVGVLSGLFPAMKAEKLQVIDALRNE